jgi:histone deacetylase 1/2
MLFTWVLSTLAESVLPRTISCHHAHQVWEEIHNYFTAQTKAKIRQLRSELKTVKKGTKTITEFILRVRAVANILISIGDSVSEQDQIDSILDGLPEEYNPFVMMIYGRPDSPSLFDIEGLLLVQESQLEKFRQELAVPSASANVAHTNGGRNSSGSRGRGRNGRGRGRNQAGSTGNRPTCQLCNKYGHHVFDCWHRFDENFVPAQPQNNPRNDPQGPKDPDPKPQACTANLASATQDLVIPKAWFPDSGAYHHLTADFENLAQGTPYHGSSKVHIGNGVGLNIHVVGQASFKSSLAPSKSLYLKHILHVPTITKNLLSVSKFANDNNVYFEFHAVDCFVKSQVNHQVLLKGSLGAYGLYSFHHLPLTKGPSALQALSSSLLLLP